MKHHFVDLISSCLDDNNLLDGLLWKYPRNRFPCEPVYLRSSPAKFEQMPGLTPDEDHRRSESPQEILILTSSRVNISLLTGYRSMAIGSLVTYLWNPLLPAAKSWTLAKNFLKEQSSFYTRA